jgi:hypothetical protein
VIAMQCVKHFCAVHNIRHSVIEPSSRPLASIAAKARVDVARPA